MAEGKKENISVSVRAYAILIGVSEKTVRNARDAGLLGDAYNPESGKVDPKKANKIWGNSQKPGKKKSKEPAVLIEQLKIKDKKPSLSDDGGEEEESDGDWFADEEIRTGGLLGAIKVSSGLRYAEAMRRREIIALAMDKKKLEEAEGVLIRRDKMERALFLLGSELKKALFAMPQRIMRDIMTAPNEIDAINIMNEELTLILNTYGGLNNAPIE